jgi:hypothetical protein
VATFEMTRKLALALPGVEDGTSYGTPALKVKKKLMATVRDDETTVAFRVGFDERDILMQAKPEGFFTTDHYRKYPAVVVRLSQATNDDLAHIVELAWSYSAGPSLVKTRDAANR